MKNPSFAPSVAAFLVLLAAPAHAIDCSTHLTPVEQSICGDETAADADTKLNDLYWSTLPRVTDRARHVGLIDGQRDWLRHREEICGAVSDGERARCVVRATTARIIDIEAAFPKAIPSEADRPHLDLD